jgi:RecB family endonuclease NucS
MGDVAAEEENGNVRGILVASDFDAKAKAAAKMVPTLILRRYSVKFLFSDGQA